MRFLMLGISTESFSLTLQITLGFVYEYGEFVLPKSLSQIQVKVSQDFLSFICDFKSLMSNFFILH